MNEYPCILVRKDKIRQNISDLTIGRSLSSYRWYKHRKECLFLLKIYNSRSYLHQVRPLFPEEKEEGLRVCVHYDQPTKQVVLTVSPGLADGPFHIRDLTFCFERKSAGCG